MDEVILARHGESELSVAGTVNGDPAVACALTETAPPVISFSAARREAIPAAAMIFCRRSEGIVEKD